LPSCGNVAKADALRRHIAADYIADPGQYIFVRSIYDGVTSISQAVANFYDYVQGTVKLKLGGR
jgi:hypothetical protein